MAPIKAYVPTEEEGRRNESVMALLNANDAHALANRSVSPERLIASFEIAEKIVHAANRGKFEVEIGFHGDPRVAAFSNRSALVEYLMARGYGVESRDAEKMIIRWKTPYDWEDDDATK